MIRMILRAILNGFLAYVVAALVLFSLASLLPANSTARTVIIAIVAVASGSAVLVVMSRLQRNTLDLTRRTLVIQTILSILVTALFLLALIIPVRS